MDRLNLKSPWTEVRERLKENDINLSDEDLEYSPGKEDELLERLAGMLNKSKKDVKEYIESIPVMKIKPGNSAG